MRGKKRVFASIDLKPEEIDLLIVKKGFTGIKTLVSETFSKDELPMVGEKIKKHRPGEAILLLPQERTIVKDVILPNVKKDKIKSALYYELSGTLPYSMEQVNLEYIVTGKSKNELEIKAFIIPEQFKREISFFREVGINITRLIPRGLAITAYLEKNGQGQQLVELTTPQGQLLLYSDFEEYFSQLYYHDQPLTETDIEEILEDKGIDLILSEPLVVDDRNKVLLGAVYFIREYKKFNLLGERVERSSIGLKVGIILAVIAILGVNAGTLYLNYQMKQKELRVYQKRLEVLTPRTKEVGQLKNDYSKIRKRFENLEKVYQERKDYMTWLKELYLLLQEDTEIDVIVFDDDTLQQLRGRAPQATRVSGRLSNSPFFEDIEFVSPITPKKEDGKIKEEFSLTGKLVRPDRKGEGTDD